MSTFDYKLIDKKLAKKILDYLIDKKIMFCWLPFDKGGRTNVFVSRDDCRDILKSNTVKF